MAAMGLDRAQPQVHRSSHHHRALALGDALEDLVLAVAESGAVVVVAQAHLARDRGNGLVGKELATGSGGEDRIAELLGTDGLGEHAGRAFAEQVVRRAIVEAVVDEDQPSGELFPSHEPEKSAAVQAWERWAQNCDIRPERAQLLEDRAGIRCVAEELKPCALSDDTLDGVSEEWLAGRGQDSDRGRSDWLRGGTRHVSR
jgi:hypothetical protein